MWSPFKCAISTKVLVNAIEYDGETGFYYLNSRYYDSEIGRFVNSDALTTTGQGALGYNMYAYCGNNPVVRRDAGGYIWETIFDVVSLAFSIADVVANPDDPWAWEGLAGDVIDLIPFVTGVGEVTRVVKTTVKVTDAIDDAYDTVKVAGDLSEVVVKYGDEVKLPNQIKMENAVEAWDDFLGPNQTSYNVFTGKNEMDRIFSADGTRSIRFGPHEMRSIGTTKAHFHYEYWKHDSVTNIVYVTNQLQRMK